MNNIKLGDKVKDQITGIVGIAVARTHWLYGCDQITIQPMGKDKEMKPYNSVTMDEPQVELVMPKRIKKGSNKNGGLKPAPVLSYYKLNS